MRKLTPTGVPGTWRRRRPFWTRTWLPSSSARRPAPSLRAQRALAAAQTKYEAGALEDALVLLAIAENARADDLLQARGHLLRAQIAFASRRGSDAPPLLLEDAREFEPIDPNLARAIYLEAFSAALFAGMLAGGCGVVEVAEAVRAGPPPPQAPSPTDLLHGLAVRFTEGYPAGVAVLKRALSAVRDSAVLRSQDARWLWFACWAAADLWDDETWDLLSARQLELVRGAGALSAIPFVLTARSAVHLVAGDLDTAASQVDEIRAVSDATGIAAPPYGPLWLAALRGQDALVSQLMETAVSDATARGEGYALADAELVRAILYNGHGRYEDAVLVFGPHGERSYDVNTPPRAVAEVIEAAARSERH